MCKNHLNLALVLVAFAPLSRPRRLLTLAFGALNFEIPVSARNFPSLFGIQPVSSQLRRHLALTACV
jgi:hypothetical protein